MQLRISFGGSERSPALKPSNTGEKPWTHPRALPPSRQSRSRQVIVDSATLGSIPPADEVRAAQRLAEALDNGGWLNPIQVWDCPLDDVEVAYADITAFGWRFLATDVPYEHRSVMFGGPLLFAATAIGSWASNRRRRREAERLASPQWRALGEIRVVVTSTRLLVWHNGGWYPVWYSAIDEVRPMPESGTLDLTFVADPPYRLAGPGICSLAPYIERVTSSAG